MTFSPLPTPRKSILIADDHLDTIETLRMLLSASDYEVSIAFNGRRAIEVANARLPRRILLDVDLPELNGFEVAHKLRESHGFDDSIIIGYSGYGGEKYYEQARASGMDFYLLKPADVDLLEALLSPDENPAILAANVVINRARELSAETHQLLLKAQALSEKGAEILRSAQEAVRQLRATRISKRLKRHSGRNTLV